ncbi:hypothetical protein [Alcaligenes faecalis]|uniref:hypothetical protein n=1 Tax=Alcaligenes faecalis TaxID=511 RepID=UPI001293ACEB|nr:hypothetical protein [Alcaligenes faecalis]
MIALAFEDQRHFIGVLALKSDGALDQGCCPDLLDRIVAQRLWIDHAIIRDVKKRLMAAGLIDDAWQPIAWEKRQSRSDSSAERTRKYRERQKKQEGDGDMTSPKRHSDALDIDKEEDKETDKEEKIKPRARAAAPAIDFSSWPAVPSPEVVADYLRHRKEIKAPLTQTAANRLGTEAQRAMAMGYSVDDFLAECMLRGWRGGKASWLEDRDSRKPAGQEKFDPLAYVNQGRIRQEEAHVIDV